MIEIDNMIDNLVDLTGHDREEIENVVYGDLDYIVKDYTLLRGIGNEDWGQYGEE